jgi:2-keto-4-pentenoate hydratase/2-oxohepta-3-ene-1,7-dioic acid hydratase in catechol pathway
MQIVRYATGGSTAYGILADDGIAPVTGSPVAPVTFEKLTNDSYLELLRNRVERATDRIDPDGVRFLSPVDTPGKIVCVGLNYHDHAEEQDEEVPERPLLFAKAPTTVTNPGDPIVHPTAVEEVDYEVELGVVIGRDASNVSASDARDYVAGYTVVNDVSARDAQFEDGQFFRGKSYDTFSPMGPTLVADDFDPNSVDVSLRVNDETKQSSNTEEFIFDVDEVVSYISVAMTLRPGDVISTGTPGGVGIFRDPPELLEPGDNVVAEIEGIGSLENPVVSE